MNTIISNESFRKTLLLWMYMSFVLRIIECKLIICYRRYIYSELVYFKYLKHIVYKYF